MSTPRKKTTKQIENTPETPSRLGLTREIAVADPLFGFQHSGFYVQTRYNPDDLIGKRGLKIYGEMRRDEQVKAALMTKKLAAVAADVEIVCDKHGNRRVLEDQKRFLEFCLGEMTGTIETYMLQVLSALDFGFSLTEPTYKPIEYGEWRGKIGWKELKVRRPEQIEFETDQFGNLTNDGVIQMGEKLPANRFGIYSYRKEFGNLYGTSDLREAHRAWFVKDKMIRFMAMGVERHAQPIGVLTLKQAISETDKLALLNILKNLQGRTGIILPESAELVFEKPSTGMQDTYTPIMKLLDHWIALSLLVPSLIGAGGGQESVGSLARSKTEQDTFLWTVEQLRNDLQEFINDRLVKTLLDLNYEITDGIYPTFRFKELTHERKMEILDRFDKALAAQSVTKTREDEEFYRSMAGWPDLPQDLEPASTKEAEVARYEKQQARWKSVLLGKAI